jgi:ABC-type branched-subunit amino acid transport system permease subunit
VTLVTHSSNKQKARQKSKVWAFRRIASFKLWRNNRKKAGREDEMRSNPSAIYSLIALILLVGISVVLARIKRSMFNKADDLLTAMRNRSIALRASGVDIAHIRIELRNLTDKWIKRVVISPGTYLIASGAHQNMVL